jgi:hypothetical protein
MATWAREELDMAAGRRASLVTDDSVSGPMGGQRKYKRGRSFGGGSRNGHLDLVAWVIQHPMGPLDSAYARVCTTSFLP